MAYDCETECSFVYLILVLSSIIIIVFKCMKSAYRWISRSHYVSAKTLNAERLAKKARFMRFFKKHRADGCGDDMSFHRRCAATPSPCCVVWDWHYEMCP